MGGKVCQNLVRVTDTTCVTESWSPHRGSIYNLFFNFVCPCGDLPKHLTFKNLGPFNHYLSLGKMRLHAFNSSSRRVDVVTGCCSPTFLHLPTPGGDCRLFMFTSWPWTEARPIKGETFDTKPHSQERNKGAYFLI